MGYSVAPLTTPSPVQGANIVSLTFLLLHGALAPGLSPDGWPAVVGEWHCGSRYAQAKTRTVIVNGNRHDFSFNRNAVYDFPPACKAGGLLDSGYDSVVQHGIALREYVKGTKLAPTSYDPEGIRVYSAYLDRAIESVVAFLHGLYPVKTKAETVKISADEGDRDRLLPIIEDDDDFIHGLPGFLKTLESRELYNVSSVKKQLAPLFKKWKIENPTDWQYLRLADVLLAYSYGNGELPAGNLNFTSIEGALRALQRLYANKRKEKLQPVNDLVLREIDYHLASVKHAKFSVIGADDITLVGFLSRLRNAPLLTRDGKLELPVASNVAVEVWDNGTQFVRVLVNGREVSRYRSVDEFRKGFERPPLPNQSRFRAWLESEEQQIDGLRDGVFAFRNGPQAEVKKLKKGREEKVRRD